VSVLFVPAPKYLTVGLSICSAALMLFRHIAQQTKHCSIVTQWAPRKVNSTDDFLTQSFLARESH